MAHADLQNLIDDLAARLDAPTVLEDDDQRMIVYSTHSEPIDDIRRDSILRRETVPSTKAWFRRFGITQATGPLRIPGDADAGVLGRLCVPVRHGTRLLGFLWLIDDDRRLGPREVSLTETVAGYVAMVLYEDELDRRLASTSLAQLLSPSAELRDAAAGRIAESALLDPDAPCVVAVVQPLGADDVHACVAEALGEVARHPHAARHLHLACDDHGVLLVQLRSRGDDDQARRLASDARDALLTRLRRRHPECRVVASTGDAQTELTAAAASYRQARLAAHVAKMVPSVGDQPRWRDLGAFRVLAQLSTEDQIASGLDPRLGTLLRSGDEPVVLTLETYLDLGCDAKVTAERLHLHRGTLYYRLQKAERIGGIDLRNGADRLSVHLGLKLARFAGLLRTPPAT
ncbi:MAG TPA: helix-turn-helix domain-containing protein [Pseudonocardiaceae bacterium]|jgi:sugar diacid utilization regulator|nr:helix-turn-helix domain-containing protein [Pseudonocardiaceae bacterium]